MSKIGFTTTIPIEVIIAAKKTPVDLNNIYITHFDQKALLEHAERDGFPRNVCSWIKGIYGVVLHKDISEVIAVTQGDCSNAQALMETLQLQGIKVIPFFFPYDKDPALLSLSLKKLMEHFEITEDECLLTKEVLDKIRTKVHLLDKLTWQENIVSGEENHYYQVSASDMNQNPQLYENEIDVFLKSIKNRPVFSKR